MVSLLSEAGDLGVGNLRKQSIPLVSKWVQSFPRKASALWHSIMTSMYDLEQSDWFANKGSNISNRSNRCTRKFIEPSGYLPHIRDEKWQHIKFYMIYGILDNLWKSASSDCSSVPAGFWERWQKPPIIFKVNYSR